MLPLLFKHYRHVIRLEDIPALREDDSSAASLAAFRKDQAYRDARYAHKHDGAKRRRNLPNDLLRFFGAEIAVQCVSGPGRSVVHSLTACRSGRAFLFACNISPRQVFAYFSSMSTIAKLVLQHQSTLLSSTSL